MKPKLNIITAVSRPENLYVLRAVIIQEMFPYFDVMWYCIYDSGKDLEFVDFNDKWILQARGGTPHDCAGGTQRNVALDMIKEGWNYFLDDDNVFFSGYGKLMSETIAKNPSAMAIAVSQFRNSGSLIATSSYMKVNHLDIAQFFIKTELIGHRRFFEDVYQSDYFFIKKLYKENKQLFHFIDKFMCHYNFLRR